MNSRGYVGPAYVAGSFAFAHWISTPAWPAEPSSCRDVVPGLRRRVRITAEPHEQAFQVAGLFHGRLAVFHQVDHVPDEIMVLGIETVEPPAEPHRHRVPGAHLRRRPGRLPLLAPFLQPGEERFLEVLRAVAVPSSPLSMLAARLCRSLPALSSVRRSACTA